MPACQRMSSPGTVQAMPLQTFPGRLAERGWETSTSEGWVAPLVGVLAARCVRASGPLSAVPGVDRGAGLRVDACARYDVSRAQYRLRRLSIDADREDLAADEVTGARLREVVPLTIMRWVLPRTIQVDPDRLSPTVLSLIAPEEFESNFEALFAARRELDRLESAEAGGAELGLAWSDEQETALEEAFQRVTRLEEREPVDRPRSGPRPSELKDAATVYRLAVMIRERPAQAVATALGLHQPTANNWLKIARREGLIE